MSGTVAELKYLQDPDGLAKSIGLMWNRYNSQRQGWLNEKKEMRNYIFATDTTTTTNSSLPWKNSTTLPKLCQIRDNLHSNYLSAAFPNDDWLRWEGYNRDSNTIQKSKAIQAYISNKARESKARVTFSKLLYDYIDYGNCFAKVEYVYNEKEDPEDGSIVPGYIGPQVSRISPLDIVFDPTADTFESSPKIVRSIKTIGELQRMQKEYPEDSEVYQAIQAAVDFRSVAGAMRREDFEKQIGFSMDGFGSMYEYLQSGYIEILTFEGDVHDPDSGEYLSNVEIVVVDRSKLVMQRPIPSWSSNGTIRHVGWRFRPDNLWAMGPLDNLVGMQYRIDHLENLKADVFDLIAHPPLKIIGQVDEFVWGPGEEIHISEGDVQMMSPDTNALQADFQIQLLEQKMEEYAGAPREAMGIRTPGEKTAFEVQSLQNAAGRIFQEKITNFEINLLEPIINDMLEVSRRNMDGVDYARVMDNDLGVVSLLEITKEDITAKGILRPVGARHFAAQAQMLQNLTGLLNSGIGQVVQQHMDTVALSNMLSDILNVDRFEIFRPNAQMYEEVDRQRLAAVLQEDLQAEMGVSPEGDIDEGSMAPGM